MADWSIRIIPNPDSIADRPALLVPDLVDALPGDPLEVQEDDLVSWNNETDQPYQPWPTDALGNLQPIKTTTQPIQTITPPPAPPPFPLPSPALYLSDMIPANLSSSPAYNVVMPASGSIVHYCLIDANGNPTKVRGQIIVSAIPQALKVPSVGG
jgi:hypothetical protein